ncbi:MAG TPA: adenylyl-sulfate kinase [Patescibacteria group bacterium]|nr:adenylyl-sulfate kinase [Patescibacteria group bacterium]
MSASNSSVVAKNKGVTIWLTGLPSAGKSTIARQLAHTMSAWGLPVELLDGDEIRERLSKGLGFSRQDRDENIRRISYVARLLSRHGVCAIVAAISPYRATRREARAEIENFVEVFVDCQLEECVRRDVKGLYKKALSGQIPQFTGISDPYEQPENPELVVHTHKESLDESVMKILETLGLLGYVSAELIQVAAITRSGARVEGTAIPVEVSEPVGARMSTGGAPSAANVGNVAASD